MTGIFDSGVGGLSAMKAARAMMPRCDIVYLGDTARVPYGTRSNAQIKKYIAEDIAFLEKSGADAVLIACATASSVYISEKMQFDIPVTEVITPSALLAAAATKNGRVGIIGTTATIENRAFENKLRQISDKIVTTAVPCPLFVPLVENGLTDESDPVPNEIARRYLTPFITFGCDTLILGCTHFPLLSGVISKQLPGVTLINSGEAGASALFRALSRKSRSGSGSIRYCVSDAPDKFSVTASRILGEKIEAEEVEIGR